MCLHERRRPEAGETRPSGRGSTETQRWQRFQVASGAGRTADAAVRADSCSPLMNKKTRRRKRRTRGRRRRRRRERTTCVLRDILQISPLFFFSFPQTRCRILGNRFLLADGHIWLPEAEIFPSQLSSRETSLECQVKRTQAGRQHR